LPETSWTPYAFSVMPYVILPFYYMRIFIPDVGIPLNKIFFITRTNGTRMDEANQQHDRL
jgi:hypothetical protein